MTKLMLPDVSLVMIETRECELARLAVEESCSKVDFGEVLVFTSDIGKFWGLKCRFVQVPDWPDKLGWSRCLWQEVAPHLRTSHFLSIQWDSWVFDPEMWRKEYLDYDYVGSPWWYKDGRNVGNGGFSLRSTRLHRFLGKNLDRFPCTTNIDDDLLCRGYRIRLEEEGFTWAPEKVAVDFSFELMRPSDDSRHFGFHGMFNWHSVLTKEQIMERAEIAYRSDYIKARMWKSFVDKNPEVGERYAA